MIAQQRSHLHIRDYDECAFVNRRQPKKITGGRSRKQMGWLFVCYYWVRLCVCLEVMCRCGDVCRCGCVAHLQKSICTHSFDATRRWENRLAFASPMEIPPQLCVWPKHLRLDTIHNNVSVRQVSELWSYVNTHAKPSHTMNR